MDNIEKTTEETNEELTPGPVMTRFIIARNYMRKHKLAAFTAVAATAVAIVSVKSNRALRDELADCENGTHVDEDQPELVAPIDDIEEAVVIPNEEIVA